MEKELPRIPRKSTPRLSRFTPEIRERIHNSLKAATLSGGFVPLSVLVRVGSERLGHFNVHYYLQWLKRYGWAECLGKQGWRWKEPVRWEEVIGHSEPIKYRFRF